jgi:hypothetical protein
MRPNRGGHDRNCAQWRVTVGAVLLLLGAGGAAAEEPTVRIRLGDDIQAVVEAHPEWTVFRLAAGAHRRQHIVPKEGQVFIGDPGAALDGSVEIGGWHPEGDLWASEKLPPPLQGHGESDEPGGLALRREDLFVGGALVRRVATRAELALGTWLEEDGRALLIEAPGTRLVELSQEGPAFAGGAAGVRIENLAVERYATDAQRGAIDGKRSRGWRLVNVHAAWNHGAGLALGDEMRVEGGSFSDNGQLGIRGGSGSGHGASVEGALIARNNRAGYAHGWEAGGIKLLGLTGVAVRRNIVEENRGAGVWLDTDNRATIVERNCVRANAGIGIHHETSIGTTIRANAVLRNATEPRYHWPWAAAILVQNSSAVEVSGNVVAVGRGDGIVLLHQERGSGAYGRHLTARNRIERNTVVHLLPSGHNGMVSDADPAGLAMNSWDHNLYIVPPGEMTHWRFSGEALGATSFGELAFRGLEWRGTVRVAADTGAELDQLLPAWCR